MPITPDTLRQAAQLVANVDLVLDAQTRTLVRAWVTAWDEVAPDLLATLLELLTAGDRISRTQLLRSERLRLVLGVIADSLDALSQASQARIVGDLRSVIDTAGAAQASILDSQLPPGFMHPDFLRSWSRVDARQIDTMVRRSTEQITALHVPLSPVAYDAVRRELLRGIAAGSNPRATAARIMRRTERAFNGGLHRALVISRTETLDAHRGAAKLGQEQHPDVVTGWTWLASLTPRTCRACLSMHGREFGPEVPGPDGHQQCRCSRMPRTVSWAELGFDDIDEPPDLTPDADEFFATLSPAQQAELLGRDGYQAWLAGDFPRDQWAKKRETPGWRDSWVPASPGDTTGGNDSTPPAPPARSTADGPRPPLSDLIVGDDPTDEQRRAVEKAWHAEMDDTFAGLRTHASLFEFYPTSLYISGQIYDRFGKVVGDFQREIHNDGTLWAEHHYLALAERARGLGFQREFNGRLYGWYRESGLERVELDANIDVGGYAWAALGYDFNDQYGAANTLTRLQFEDILDDEDAASVADVLDRAGRHPYGHANYPTALEFSQAGRTPQHVGKDAMWPGKRAMMGLGKTWRAVLWL